MPTPKRMTMTPAEELDSELMAAGFPRRPLTREQFDRNKLSKDIVSDYRAGGEKRQEALTALREGKAKGMLDARAEHTMITRLGLTPMQYQIQHLGPEDAMRVWRVANPRERAQIKVQVVGRVQNSRTLERSKREAFAKELIGAEMQYHNPRVAPPEPGIGTWLLVLVLFLAGGWGALWSIGHLVMWVLGH